MLVFRNISLIIFIYMFAVLVVFAFTKRQVGPRAQNRKFVKPVW